MQISRDELSLEGGKLASSETNAYQSRVFVDVAARRDGGSD